MAKKRSTAKQKAVNPAAARARRMRRGRMRAGTGALLRALWRLSPLLLVAGALYGAWWGLGQWETFAVRRVAVRNNARAGAEDILALSNLSARDNLFRIDCDEIKAQVEEHPWVSQAAVYRRFPTTVVIDVSEWRPVLAANTGDGGLHLISQSGTPFKPAAVPEAGNLPMLAGLSARELERESRRARDAIDNALEVLSLAGTLGLPEGRVLSEIEVIGAGADVAVLFSAQTKSGPKAGPYVVLGPPPFERKWRRLGELWTDLESREVEPARIQFVSDARAVVVPAGRAAAKI